jgi:putative transposase
MPRLIVPGYPHHATQRGSRRQRTFFGEDDYRFYLALLAKARLEADVSIWAYCLMPNHVHLVAVPRHAAGLAFMFRTVHRAYACRINEREGWRGHLWQERFHSCVMDESHLLAAVKYVELNPVRAELCGCPEEWPWSSVHAHLAGGGDSLVDVAPMASRIGNWREYLDIPASDSSVRTIRRNGHTGRPAGDEAFLLELERLTGRQLRRRKPGPVADGLLRGARSVHSGPGVPDTGTGPTSSSRR